MMGRCDRWAAQLRLNSGAALLTRTVTDRESPLFDTAAEAYASLLTPPADHSVITAEIWREFTANASIEVWRIYVDGTSYRRATYVPVSEYDFEGA